MDLAAFGLIPITTENYSEVKNADVAMINQQWSWLENEKETLNNVNQTHVADLIL